MNDIDKVQIQIEGLGCASCADKMERRIRVLPGVSAATVSFATGELMLQAEDPRQLQEITAQAAAIVREIEPGARLASQPDDCREGGAGVSCDNCEVCAITPGRTAGQGSADAAAGSRRASRLRIFALAGSLALFLAASLLRLPAWLDDGLFLAAYALAGGEVLVKAARNLLRGQVLDEHFLMSVATIGALALGELGEAVAVMIFYQVGSMLENRAVSHSRRSISALLDIRPDYANVKTSSGFERVDAKKVAVGELIAVKPGERVPLDGIVHEGRSFLDTSALTGEAVPRAVEPGQVVYAGSINKNNLFVVEVTHKFSDSTVSRILDLVQNAASHKAPTENFISRLARFYTPMVIASAVLLAVLPPLILPGAMFAVWLKRALLFLVISCPCALVISIPLGFFGGIGGAARQGILFKGGNYLEALNRVDTIIFDKTGTLTRGVFKVTDIQAVGLEKAELLALAVRAESLSNHPIAQSIVQAAGRHLNDAELSELSEFEEIPGLGVAVRWQDRQLLAGNARLMAAESISVSEPEVFGTIVHVAYGGSYCGYLIISDELKPDAENAIQDLRGLGIEKLILFTGDSQAAGEAIGGRLGLTAVHGELLPDQKVAELELLKKIRPNGKLLFVGDGINDAPVLARSDVGIAMGGLGSAAAIEAADIVIMNDEPSKVAMAIRIARRTHRIVWQNIILALAIKGAIMLLGALGLANLWEAVFADVGVAILAIFNSLRALSSRQI